MLSSDDFFQVVPPTPFDFGNDNGNGHHHDLGHEVNYYHPQESDHDANNHTHHLRPTSIRSHRSTSHASISSSLSVFSSNTQWGSESEITDGSIEYHVDPRLFQTQPKEKEEEEAAAIEVLASPAPPKKKTKKARTAEEKAERKKVSHARKVSCPKPYFERE